jgi:hypothetical protein
VALIISESHWHFTACLYGNLLVPSDSWVVAFSAQKKNQTLTVDTYLELSRTIHLVIPRIIPESEIFEAKIRFISIIIFTLSLFI